MMIKFLLYFVRLGSLSQALSEPSAISSEETFLEGVDISNWQAGIPFSKLPGDFVIIQATSGTQGISPNCQLQVEIAVLTGKCVGVYHYARERGSERGSAVKEARWFLEKTRDFRGKVVPILYLKEYKGVTPTWAKTWLDIVANEWGVKNFKIQLQL